MRKFFNVIIPVYNSTRLEKALKSIEIQENKDEIEVIIVNDCDGKEYDSLLSQFSFDYKIITNEVNVGQGLSRQIGLDAATAEWITFLDHDDEYTQEAFKFVKKELIESKCSFVYATQMIIAEDDHWIETGKYTIIDPKCTLHGQFYNLDKLRKYNIHFNNLTRPHEDTYFLSLLDGHFVLNEEIREDKNSLVISKVATYIWYMWEESVTHTKIPYKDFEITYLEDTIEDYLIINLASLKILYDTYKDDYMMDEFLKYRVASTLYFCYWNEQYFMYSKKFKEENLQYIKNAAHEFMKYINCKDMEHLVNYLISEPIMYHETYLRAVENIELKFIPLQTVAEFYLSL